MGRITPAAAPQPATIPVVDSSMDYSFEILFELNEPVKDVQSTYKKYEQDNPSPVSQPLEGKSRVVWGVAHLIYPWNPDRDISFVATSGATGKQVEGYDWAYNKGGRLPPSKEVPNGYSVSTAEEKDNAPGIQGVKYRVSPLVIRRPGSSGDPNAKRDGLLFHFDANGATYPGSAGCVVLKKSSEWSEFRARMKEAKDHGINSIPVEVVYHQWPDYVQSADPMRPPTPSDDMSAWE